MPLATDVICVQQYSTPCHCPADWQDDLAAFGSLASEIETGVSLRETVLWLGCKNIMVELSPWTATRYFRDFEKSSGFNIWSTDGMDSSEADDCPGNVWYTYMGLLAMT